MNKTTKAYIDFDNYINNNLSEGLFKCNINLTSLCQHECIMCFKENKFLKINSYIPIDKLKEYYYWFRSLGGAYVFISGGEPLLYPFFNDFINFLEDLRYNVCIVTNGLLLDKHKDSLAKQNITEIRLSLLGLDTIHDKLVNKSGSFRIIMKNIINSKELFDKIQINFTVLKSNYIDIDKFVIFLINDIGIKKILISFPFINQNNLIRIRNELLSLEQKRDLLKNIAKLKSKYQNEIIYSAYNKNQNNRCYPFCGLGWPYHFCINFDNQIWPCGEYEKNIINIKKIKNASQFYKSISKASFWKYISNLNMIKCENCKYNCYCYLCIAQNYQNTGHPDCPSVYQCEAAKDIYEALHD